MTMPDLKPCPFCGGNDLFVLKPTCHISKPYNENDRLYPLVRCRSCYAEVPGRNNQGPRDDRSARTAFDAWNTRTYTQEDLNYAIRDAQAEAYERAAEAIEPHPRADVKTGGVLYRAQQAIRALITTDHAEALEAVRQEARIEAFNEAAQLCQSRAIQHDDEELDAVDTSACYRCRDAVHGLFIAAGGTMADPAIREGKDDG